MKENETKYKSGIKEYIGSNISKIKLIFIFDEETQINKKNNNIPNSGMNLCLEKKYYFIYFLLRIIHYIVLQIQKHLKKS